MNLWLFHHSSDFYGSGQSFLASVKAFRRAYPDAEALFFIPSEGWLPDALNLPPESIAGNPVPLGRSTLRPYAFLSFLAQITRLARQIRRLARRTDGPVVIYQNSLAAFGAVVGKLLLRRRATLITHVRETAHRRFHAWVLVTIMNRADRVIFVSKATRGFWKERGLKVLDSHVVHNGVRADLYSASLARERARVFEPPYRITCVGRINWWKGQQTLVEAFDRLSRDDLWLDFYGGPPPGQPEALGRLEERVARSPYSDQIDIRGETLDIEGVYRAAHLLVIPSEQPEPFGLTIVEGMAFGCIVIAARHGGAAEIFRDGIEGFYFEPGSADDLAAVIDRVLARDDLEKIAANAVRAARERFGPEQLVRELARFFR